MDALRLKSVDLQPDKNQLNHKTNGLSSSTLVLRRGQAFQILLNFDGRAFDPSKDKLVFRLNLGPLSAQIPMSRSPQPASGLPVSGSVLPVSGTGLPGSGYPGSGSSLPGSGLSVSGSGLAVSGSSLPGSGSGLSVSGSGLAVSGSSLPGSGSGLSVSGSGLAVSGSSLPGSGSGLSVSGFGLPVSGASQPVSGTPQPSTTQWSATLERTDPSSPRTISVLLLSPALAPVGVYTLGLKVETRTSVKSSSLGQFTLLCNPWCQGDSVFLSSEELREEYVRSDIGLLFKGTSNNFAQRPWSFDQYEKGILDICMKLLDLSPQYRTDRRKDLLDRTNPVYIGRVISAMINSQDDRGVLMGNWSGEYNDGINPSTWSGSAEILKQWSDTNYRPVKYGQCWVFAAVMCTVMRALGIPTRPVTNFNSAHDTNGNMVIEEYYSEYGKKLSFSQDSIWNFHVWVESWMKRPDLGKQFDGWQVLDATPQEKSSGMYRCGPAALKAIRDKNVEAQYDVPFVFAEVNADVRTMIVRDRKILSSETDTKRVGALICTKRPGMMNILKITSEYKTETDDRRAPFSADRFGESSRDKDRFVARPSVADRFGESSRDTDRFGESPTVVPKVVAVSLSLLKLPVVGENIKFSVTVTNNETIPKQLKAHINAQNKEYNRNPTGTFWEVHDDLKLAPNESQTLEHEIPFDKYALKEPREDYMVNLAVVIEDLETQKRILTSQEFNITSPSLSLEVTNETSILVNMRQLATVVFTSPFTIPVNGELTVMGSGLLEEKIQTRITLQPGETMKRPVEFIPRMTGSKMLQASLVLTNLPSVLHGFKTINVKQV